MHNARATAPFRTAVINRVLEVPFCSDIGADVNIVGRYIIDELKSLTATVHKGFWFMPRHEQCNEVRKLCLLS